MRLLLAILSFCAAGTALAQELAGRILVAAGDVAIVRAGQRVTAGPGAEVRTGDRIVVGENSVAQVRMTDESLISFQPRTTFEVSEYAFQGLQADKQRAIFRLLLGGMRTVTGLIGRVHQAGYRVATPTSTIGIRGTHYTLAHRDEFVLRDGSKLPGGTYGAVTDGRIAVANQAGETVFGADQYFRVPSPTALPQQLLRPPTEILSVRTERRQTAQQQQQQQGAAAATGGEAAPTVAQTGASAGTGDTRVSSSVSQTAIPLNLSTTVYQPTTELSVVGPTTVLEPTLTGTVVYRLAGPFNISVACSNPPCGTIVNGHITLGLNLTLGLGGLTTSFITDSGEKFDLSTPSAAGGFPITIANGQVSFNATANRVDFPQNQFAFRCSACGPGGTVGFMDSISVSGTISGSQATVTLTGVDAGGTNTFTATLPSATPPNNVVASAVIPTFGGGAAARSSAFWGVEVDASRALLKFAGGGQNANGQIGSATNTIAGSDAAAGNLVWGAWTGSGAQVTDQNYVAFTTGAGTFIPWITGEATNTLPASLGVVSFTPIGSFVNGGGGTLNSASLTADFVNRSLSVSLNATNPGAGNTFQMNGSTGVSPITGRFSSGFQSVTCSGPCSAGTPGGSFAGFFAGSSAQGAGVTFSAGYAIPGVGVSGVAAFKR